MWLAGVSEEETPVSPISVHATGMWLRLPSGNSTSSNGTPRLARRLITNRT
jgi:hypothetical protein